MIRFLRDRWGWYRFALTDGGPLFYLRHRRQFEQVRRDITRDIKRRQADGRIA